MKSLSLNSNKIGYVGFQILQEILKKCEKIEHFSLNENPLCDESMSILQKEVFLIEEVEFSNCLIGY